MEGTRPSRPSRLGPPEGIGGLRRERLHWARLYFVCDALPYGEDPELLLRAAMSGGVGMIELRDREQPPLVIERSGATYRRLADTYSALFIVNDDPNLANELAADGVHVGQDDMAPAEAREILGPDAIIGLSTHSVEQMRAAQDEPVDYISVGPIWETPTKEGRPGTGLELISAAAQESRLPWFAIGGIDTGNAAEVVGSGARRICVVRAIRDADDPAAAAAALVAPVDAAVKAERERTGA
jgi:thiamine-phosphate diphosphorylase